MNRRGFFAWLTSSVVGLGAASAALSARQGASGTPRKNGDEDHTNQHPLPSLPLSTSGYAELTTTTYGAGSTYTISNVTWTSTGFTAEVTA